MTSRLVDTLTFSTAISSGLVAGVFFAFSSFIMAGLGRLTPADGAAAMNSINLTVLTPMFMLALFGTGLVCVVLGIQSYGAWNQTKGLLTFISCIVYVVGSIGVTMVCNVPLNDALAAVQPGSPEAATLWSRYLSEWTMWNTVRTVASLASAILFTAASICGRLP